MTSTRLLFCGLCILAFGSVGCNGNSTTSPTTTTTDTTTTTTTASAPTVTETFSGTLTPSATLVFPFSVTVYGTVNLALVDVTGPTVPATMQVRLGIGTPDGAGGCTLSATSLSTAGTTTQVTATKDVGDYCALIADVGNLVGTAAFDITVAHP